MKRLILALTLTALLVAPALAEKPLIDQPTNDNRVACDLLTVCWMWDGTFTAEACDSDGLPVWEYGVATGIPGVDCDGNAIENVLGTVLAGDYPNDAGERAILGSFEVTGSCYLLEMCHYYDTENSYDGCNVEVMDASGGYTVVSPMGGYPDDLISDSTNYYAWCVDNQPGFTDGPTAGFVKDCFDLTAYMGQEVTVAVKFGSDSSVQYPGWYIASVVAGGLTTPTDDNTWSTIKSLF